MNELMSSVSWYGLFSVDCVLVEVCVCCVDVICCVHDDNGTSFVSSFNGDVWVVRKVLNGLVYGVSVSCGLYVDVLWNVL